MNKLAGKEKNKLTMICA